MTWLRRYNLPSERGQGWAYIVLGSDGLFTAASDYGGYGFVWSHHGCRDFREFLIHPERDPDYFLSKLSSRDRWDGDETARKVRRAIIEARRNGSMSAERARAEYDLVTEHSTLDSREDFAFWWRETSLEDAHEFATYVYPPDARAFVTKTLPRLGRLLEAELAAERAQEGATL